MEEYSVHISPNCNGKIIDVCGTGGDKLKTFNISTTASFVIAGAGGNVAKHGNRSISGVSGSADIFEYFGFDLNSEPNKVNETIEKFGIGFMFAQKFHPFSVSFFKDSIIGLMSFFNISKSIKYCR